MKTYKESLRENSIKAEGILMRSKITHEELYEILKETGHNVWLWKGDKILLSNYLIGILDGTIKKGSEEYIRK